jgi:hypothetical protein
MEAWGAGGWNRAEGRRVQMRARTLRHPTDFIGKEFKFKLFSYKILVKAKRSAPSCALFKPRWLHRGCKAA